MRLSWIANAQKQATMDGIYVKRWMACVKGAKINVLALAMVCEQCYPCHMMHTCCNDVSGNCMHIAVTL